MPIRWALLGPGKHAAKNVVPQMARAADTELAAVVSRDRARGEAFARSHGVGKAYQSLDEALADPAIDALYDATPDGLHAAHAVAAAKAGKHILVEKPMALSVAEGQTAVEACRQAGVLLGVVFNQRHEAAHQDARRRVLAGEIGEVKLVQVQIAMRASAARTARPADSWRTDPRMRPRGIASSIGDHAYDTLSYIAGQQIETVAALADAAPKERVAALLLALSKGAIGYAAASYVTPYARRPFEIHGTAGSLIVENSYAYLTGASDDPAPTVTLVNDRGRSVTRFESSDCFRLEVEQFNRAIRGQARPMTPADEGLRILAVSEAIYAALAAGRTAAVADFLQA
jgi:1,5-anhydro-D-fructose reductase (1,5-anhydro-D-mannitol-forming)